MSGVEVESDRVLMSPKLVSTLKSTAEPFEEAYQWISRLDVHLNPRETVCTIAFASKGIRKISHLTWSELLDLHRSYEQLKKIEQEIGTRTSTRGPL